jgi:hypothetical protein
MKKVAFILSLILFSIGFTPAQAAQCKDGTYSSSTGRGTCSGHGGVASWGSAPAQSISKAAVEANLKRQKEIAIAKAAADKAIKDKADADARKLGFKNAAAKILSDKLAESKRIADEKLEQAKNEAEMEAAKQASLSASYKKHDEDILNANNMLNSELQNINALFLPKASLADSQYNSSLLKWKEVDQVKLNNFKPFVWPKGALLSYNFYHPMANGGFMSGTLNYQDDPHNFSKLRDVINFDSCWVGGTWSCSQNNIYQMKEKLGESATWDFEGLYGKSVNWDYIRVTVVSFSAGLLTPVRDDGSKVNYIEFETIRNSVKSSYANKLSLEKEYKSQVALVNAKFAKLIGSIKSAHEEEVKTIMEGN